MSQVMNLAAPAASAHDSAPSPERASSHGWHGSRHATAPSSVVLTALVPALLIGSALCVWMGFQTWLLAQEREALLGTHASQQEVVDRATKLRASLDALAADTRRLADAGNANAKLLVNELSRRGVTINASAAAAATAVPSGSKGNASPSR